MRALNRAVVLVGFMGAGKTSVGRALAERLNWSFEDLDDRVTARERRTVPEIFKVSGEFEFRRAEHAALQTVIEELQAGSAKVVALGGGAFVQKANADLLEASGIPTVFLDAPADELWKRCSAQASAVGIERPLLHGMDQFRELYEARRTNYAKASVRVDTKARTVAEIAAEIQQSLGLEEIVVRREQGEVE